MSPLNVNVFKNNKVLTSRCEWLCSWSFRHRLLSFVFMKRQPNQLLVWDVAGRLYLHFYKIYYNHSRCTLAHKLISPMFAKHSHSVARVKWLARSMAHDVILGKSSVFKRRLDSSQNSQLRSECGGSRQKPRVLLTCSVYLALFIPKVLQEHANSITHWHCQHCAQCISASYLRDFHTWANV